MTMSNLSLLWDAPANQPYQRHGERWGKHRDCNRALGWRLLAERSRGQGRKSMSHTRKNKQSAFFQNKTVLRGPHSHHCLLTGWGNSPEAKHPGDTLNSLSVVAVLSLPVRQETHQKLLTGPFLRKFSARHRHQCGWVHQVHQCGWGQPNPRLTG